MKPATFSATALDVADSCMSRYYYEINQRGSRLSNDAADLGTAVHAAIEQFVQMVHIDRVLDNDIKYLRDFYNIAFQHLLGLDTKSVWYKDGLKMVNTWWGRTDFTDVEVLSCEVKDNFPIPTSIGPIPFNFVIDRLDRIGPHEYRVVDYKSIRVPVSSQELHTKLQARCYALAVQIKYPDAERIWVEFDLLRHERVGTVFDREEQKATWKYLKKLGQSVVDADPENLLESINKDCRYCIRKATCETLQKNVSSGGIFSLTVDDAIARITSVKDHIAALKSLEEELNRIIIDEAVVQDTLNWTNDEGYEVLMTAQRRRSTLPNQIATIIDAEVMADYAKMNVGDFDRMMEDPRLTDEQKDLLRKKAIVTTVSEPTPKITKKGLV